MALIPHDVFNDMIKHADIKTLWQLSNTDKTIKQICMDNPFYKVLLKFSTNPYFNLDAKSTVLDNFLNDLVGNDIEMLKRLQTSFGACLMGKNISNQIIVLDGFSNGKSTFLELIGKLFGDMYMRGAGLSEEDSKYYNNTHIVRLYDTSDWPMNFVSRLKYLSEDNPKFTMVIDPDTGHLASNDQDFNKRLNNFNFRTTYVNNPHHSGEKLKQPNMLNQLLLDGALPALLNFLLEGCREVLDN